MDVPAPDIFISHASSDETLACAADRALRRAGLRTFLLTQREGRPGSAWFAELDAALGQVRMIVVLVTPRAVVSRWVEYEWRTASVRAIETGSCVVLPVLVEGPDPSELPAGLKYWGVLDLRRSRSPRSRWRAVVAAAGVAARVHTR